MPQTTLSDLTDTSEGDGSQSEKEHDEPDDASDLYHPTDEWDALEESGMAGIDGGRMKNLEAAKQKSRLDPCEEPFKSLAELRNAVRELSLARQDGRLCIDLPAKALDQITATVEALPDDAVTEFLADKELRTRINRARSAFNDWLSAYQRKQEMPGWQEAGPANYNSGKFKRLEKSERQKRDSLTEQIDSIRACANGGAKQRALEAIGSSVAEQTAQKEKQQQARRRKQLEKGQIVTYRSPREHVGVVHRVNKKSVRIERPNPRYPGTKPMSEDPEPEYIRETVKLDSAYLTPISRNAFDSQLDALTDIDGSIPEESYDTAVAYFTEQG